MRKASRWILISAAVAAASLAAAVPASAVSPHFNFANVTAVTSNSITVTFKESGLGNSLDTVYITLTGTAECINGGSNHPKASNKEAEGTPPTPVTVSNGQASGSLTMTASNLSCSPPMTIAWTDLVIHDITFNDNKAIPGRFSPTS